MDRRTVFGILVGSLSSNGCSSVSSDLQEDRSRKISYRFNARLLPMTSIRGFSIKGKFCSETAFNLCIPPNAAFLLRNAEGKIALSTKTCQAARLCIECNTEISQNCIVLHCYDHAIRVTHAV